jgi:hypothetical protein
LSDRTLEITYDSKPPIFGTIVIILATLEGEPVFTGLFNTLPPHDIMNVKLLGQGQTSDAVEIIRFLSEKINAPVRMDMSANEAILTEEEIVQLGKHIELIRYEPSKRTDIPGKIEAVV